MIGVRDGPENDGLGGDEHALTSAKVGFVRCGQRTTSTFVLHLYNPSRSLAKMR